LGLISCESRLIIWLNKDGKRSNSVSGIRKLRQVYNTWPKNSAHEFLVVKVVVLSKPFKDASSAQLTKLIKEWIGFFSPTENHQSYQKGFYVRLFELDFQRWG
jgi:hypothetical protein